MKNSTKDNSITFPTTRLENAVPLNILDHEAIMTRFMTGDDSEEVQQVVLIDLYLTHAITAYKSYLAHRRGALFLPLVDGRPLGPLSDDQYQRVRQTHVLHTAYLKVDRSRQFTDPDNSEIISAMDSYDPENQIVLVVLQPGRSQFIAVVGKANTGISPRELYEENV
jgi:hypothetical protein